MASVEGSAPTKNQALAALRHFYDALVQRHAARTLRFREKGGKDRDIPVRHDLEGWINEYVAAAGIAEESKASPLFCNG